LCEGVKLAFAFRAILNELIHPTFPFLKNVACVTAVTILFGWVIGGAAYWLAYLLGYGFAKEEVTTTKLQSLGFVMVAFIAPIVETFLLAGVVKVLGWLSLRQIHTSVMCGLMFGSFHAWSNGPIAFFAPSWSFFVFSLTYQAWRPRTFPHAFWAAMIPHSINNSLVLLLL
jgi:hypothetical protein